MHLVVSLVSFAHRGLMLAPWNLHSACFLAAMCLKEQITSEWCRNNRTTFENLGSGFQESSADVSFKKVWHCLCLHCAILSTPFKPKYVTDPSSEVQNKELDKSSKAKPCGMLQECTFPYSTPTQNTWTAVLKQQQLVEVCLSRPSAAQATLRVLCLTSQRSSFGLASLHWESKYPAA